MAKRAPRGTCDGCNETNLLLRSVGDKNMCGKCSTIYSNTRNWLPVVEMALAEIYPEKYGAALLNLQKPSDVVAVAVESVAMERIAAAVGYAGTDGDGLIAAVETMVGDHRALLISDRWKPSPDVIRALELPKGIGSWTTVELVAMQIAAQLEDKERDDSAVQILRLRDILGLPFVRPSALIDQVEQIVGGLEGDNDQVNHLREQLQGIRIALGVTDPAFDVARAIGELAQTLDRYKSTCERLTADALMHEYPVVTPPTENGKQIESMILDLSLMALRGEVIGLDPAFLSAMREAA